ncbi:uncharacterized protein LOC123987954 [Osmia bicornis bicornis]|uniref:uncharacterized protein LOC123987954 n=1 Tax=Osmia bicornis bicornis TaxID=1437191 RepID=UPI001EAF6EDC|nr:uncharacterized protein LOC123987954 [Osmia bicornis bicornis]
MTEDRPGKRWYEVIEDAEYALNNTVNKATGDTPCKLLFGVDQTGKVPDVLKKCVQTEASREPSKLEECRRVAAGKNLQQQNYNKTYYDKKHKPPYEYQVGDYIMLKNFVSTPGVSQKLIPQFKGPYEIIRKLRNDRYVVADVRGFQNTQRPYQGTWSSANMRPWCPN